MSDLTEPAPIELASRLALRQSEAAAVLGISVRAFRNLQSEIPHIRRGGVVLVPIEGLKAWLDEQSMTTKIDSAAADQVLSDLMGR